MSLARVAGVFVVLSVLCACPGRGESEGPSLPDIELPSTTVGLAYEFRITAVGGVAPLLYSITDIPPGFSFYSDTALLAGPATIPGDYTLTIGVTDGEGAQSSRAYRLRVAPVPSITTATALPQASSGTAYELALAAQGGQHPLVWSLASGSLPPGLTVQADGRLSGVPEGPGSFSFTVRVQDAHGAQATRQFSLEVKNSTQAFPLQVGNWNVEWFGSITEGPADETLQRNNVRTVLQGADADFWALEEIVDVNHFNALKQSMPGYDGFVANDPLVTGGEDSYSSGEQKLAVLYKSSVVSVQSARIILTDKDYEFGTRPPLRVDLRVTRNGSTVDLVAIVLHMKADVSETDYTRRQNAAAALKQYLDQQLPTARVIVLGDWNDDLDQSIVSGKPTPYQNFLDAPAAYTFLTQPLSSVSSSVTHSGFIDHQLVTNELAANHVSQSTQRLLPTITNYGNTTSDHYPIVSRFDFGQVTQAPISPIFINEFLPQPAINPDTGTADFDQQFVEIVNTGAASVDLGGWKVHDAESFSGAKPVRHTFPAGTMLAPGKAYVVYSGATAVPTGATQATYANGNDGLRFNRGVNQSSSGDAVYLVKPDGTVADSYNYRDTYQDVSYNRSPDLAASGTWVFHADLPAGLDKSPGKRANGTDF